MVGKVSFKYIKCNISISLCSPQYALHVYNEVMSVGQKYGIRNAGYYALRSLRIEKFFAFWGQDLDAFTTPLECGREFRVKFDKVCSQFSCVSTSKCTISVNMDPDCCFLVLGYKSPFIWCCGVSVNNKIILVKKRFNNNMSIDALYFCLLLYYPISLQPRLHKA